MTQDMHERDGYVCIVDDDPDIREIVQLVLEASGHRVRTAADGLEALDTLRRHPGACLVLLDLMMPGMNGWEFRAEQLKDPPIASIPVVVLSGVREVPVQAAGLNAAASLQKPIDLDQLVAVVERHCR